MKNKYRRFLIISILSAVLIIIVSGIVYVNDNLPNTIFVNANQCTNMDFSMPVSINADNSSSLCFSGENKINAGSQGEYHCDYKLFGIFSVKKSKVKVVDKTYVYPSGVPIGLYLKTQGVMIIDSGEFYNSDGEKIQPLKGKVYPGEYIVKFNDINVSNKSQLSYLIKENGEKQIVLSIKNNNEIRQIEVCPQKNEEGEYVIGIWVRDDSQGLGTMTFITEDNIFAALGHGISDIDTGKMLSAQGGSIYNANIWGIKKGVSGKPGGLCGNIIYNDDNIIGNIKSNNSYGIYGYVMKEKINIAEEEKMELGFQNDVKKGAAQIRMELNGKIHYYDIKIIDINTNSKDKNMVIEIVDKDLLKITNGIVQGMSGCPIIQNNKVIGAVTHVMVNNPSKGYGIFAENMLNKCLQIQ